MNDLVKEELTEKIIQALLKGENPEAVSQYLLCDINVTYQIMASEAFRSLCKQKLESLVVFNGLAAINRIEEISRLSASDMARLGASKWLAENALNINKLGHVTESPANMTQDQLARRLKDLQNEAIKRAKPIDTGVIEQSSIDDML